MQALNDFYSSAIVVSALFLIMAFVKVAFFIFFSTQQHFKHKRRSPKKFKDGLPYVSVIIPCYNEELTLNNCVDGLIKQIYGNLEIIVIDDGSSDKTWDIAKRLENEYPHVKSFSKENGGKASALNYGLEKANGSIIICMDADSIFLKNTVYELILSFEDPEVMAVGGNVRVANRNKLLNKHQSLEYITGLTLQRRAFSRLGCMQVISGAIGAFRKDKLIEIGGYSNDTIVEDMDITIEMSRRGNKVVYNPLAIAYTEAPELLSDFWKQRYRWIYGGFQVIDKHRDVLFNSRFGKLGLIGLPYFALFPWMDVAVSCLLFFAIVRVVITGDYLGTLLFFLALVALQMTMTIYALIIDKESKRLIFLAGIDNLFYNQVISLVIVWAGVNFAFKRGVNWNKLQRYGRNVSPVDKILPQT